MQSIKSNAATEAEYINYSRRRLGSITIPGSKHNALHITDSLCVVASVCIFKASGRFRHVGAKVTGRVGDSRSPADLVTSAFLSKK